MNRIVCWHMPHPSEPLPTFYMERDYTPEKVRIYAENAPIDGDFEVDIRDDGTTIFANRSEPYTTISTVLSKILYNTLATSTFSVGEVVTGNSSSARGTVVSDGYGEMTLRVLDDTNFSIETITGQTSNATAVVLSFYRGGTPSVIRQDAPQTKATLPEGANLEESAEDFPVNKEPIKEGSVLTCHVLKSGGASNVTVQLELLSVGEVD